MGTTDATGDAEAAITADGRNRIYAPTALVRPQGPYMPFHCAPSSKFPPQGNYKEGGGEAERGSDTPVQTTRWRTEDTLR